MHKYLTKASARPQLTGPNSLTTDVGLVEMHQRILQFAWQQLPQQFQLHVGGRGTNQA